MSPMLVDMINSHLKRYPASEVVDIYKLLYQAANGPAHFALDFDIDDFRKDWDDATSFDFPALEPISVDGELVRAHFAPLKEQGVNFENLINAFTLTVQYFEPRPQLLVNWWKELGELIEGNFIPLPYSQYVVLDEEFRQWGFVAKHHSQSFVRAYNPHYLVVLRRFISP